MSRRAKHLLQELERDLPPLGEDHEVVKVVAPRGGSIVDVERADGTRSLCLMPIKFNRTLWVKRDGFLLIERADGIPPLQPTCHAQPGLQSQQGVCRNGQPVDSSNLVSPLSQSHLAPPQPHLSPSQPHPAPSQPHPPPSQSQQASSQSHAVPSPSAASEVTSGHTQQASDQSSTHSTAAESREQLHDNGNHQPAAAKGLTPLDSPKQAVVPGQVARAAVGTAGGAAIRSSQPAAQGSSKIMGTIVAVLYDEQIKQLKKTPGAWPPEFGHKDLPMPANQVPGADNSPERNKDSSDDDSEDGLPPLEKNMNRRIIVHDDSDEDEDESDDES